MKKIFLTLLSVSLLLGASAQVPFTFGPRVGLNISRIPAQLDSVTNLDASNVVGITAGLFFRGNMGKLYIQPEVYFSMKGGKLSYDSTGGNGLKEIRLKSVDVPVLIGLKAFETGKFNLRVMGGPVLSIPVNKTIKETFSGQSSETISQDDFKKILWGVQAGIGIDIYMFTFDFRYEWGLGKVYESNNISFRNNMYSLSLSWKIM